MILKEEDILDSTDKLLFVGNDDYFEVPDMCKILRGDYLKPPSWFETWQKAYGYIGKLYINIYPWIAYRPRHLYENKD